MIDDHAIQATERRLHFAHQLRNPIRIGEVTTSDERAPAEFANLAGNRIGI
jgi:hypothetical protein